jgi:hypothetical protein
MQAARLPHHGDRCADETHLLRALLWPCSLTLQTSSLLDRELQSESPSIADPPAASDLPSTHDITSLQTNHGCPSSPIKDILIVGGGPAGLAAALTLYRALRTVTIFDASLPRQKTPVHLTPSWEHETPGKFRESARAELEKTELAEIVSVKSVAVVSEPAIMRIAVVWIISFSLIPRSSLWRRI